MPEEAKTMTVRTEYIRRDGFTVAYIKAAEKTNATVTVNGKNYTEISNQREPYDFRMHIFEIPASELPDGSEYTVRYQQRGKRASEFFTEPGQTLEETVRFSAEQIYTVEQSQNRSDRGLTLEEVYDRGGSDGFSWKCAVYRTPAGEPVHVYTMIADPRKTSFLCGTPHLAGECRDKDIQTVMEEAEEAQRAGKEVLGATNGDFFDMFGNCAPSGLCVTEGRIVANPDTPNPFFGITREGKPVIGYAREYPVSGMQEAIGGGQVIVRNGKMAETAPMESFGEVTHPRTAFGIREDGAVLAMVVDGRRPSWSNGAALSELAKLMIAEGAVTALNTDGGGSSTFIVRRETGLAMLNHPADLVRPMEDLVRPLFNSLIIYRKND